MTSLSSLEYQTATSELLEVISRSTADVQPVLDAMLAAASRLCDASLGAVAVKRSDGLFYVATIGTNAEYDKYLRGRAFLVDRSTAVGRAAMTKQPRLHS